MPTPDEELAAEYAAFPQWMGLLRPAMSSRVKVCPVDYRRIARRRGTLPTPRSQIMSWGVTCGLCPKTTWDHWHTVRRLGSCPVDLGGRDRREREACRRAAPAAPEGARRSRAGRSGGQRPRSVGHAAGISPERPLRSTLRQDQ